VDSLKAKRKQFIHRRKLRKVKDGFK